MATLTAKKTLKSKTVKPVRPLKNEELPDVFQKALPGLGIKKDKLVLSLHFYEQSVIMQNHDGGDKSKAFKMFDPHDAANILAGSLSFGTGILPGDEKTVNALWWANSKNGPATALWYPPAVRPLAIAKEKAEPERLQVPLPGLIFICRPGNPPWVYAASRRPRGIREKIYRAPLANVYDDGNSCPGSVSYPADIAGVPETFLRSFFTSHVAGQKSKKHKGNIADMWRELVKKKAASYPIADLFYHGTVRDLMGMRI